MSVTQPRSNINDNDHLFSMINPFSFVSITWPKLSILCGKIEGAIKNCSLYNYL